MTPLELVAAVFADPAPLNRDDRACVGVDIDVFFPSMTIEMGEVDHPDFAAARAVCGSCRVVSQCLTNALAEPATPYGVQGGKSRVERLRLRSQRTRILATHGKDATDCS